MVPRVVFQLANGLSEYGLKFLSQSGFFIFESGMECGYKGQEWLSLEEFFEFLVLVPERLICECVLSGDPLDLLSSTLYEGAGVSPGGEFVAQFMKLCGKFVVVTNNSSVSQELGLRYPGLVGLGVGAIKMEILFPYLPIFKFCFYLSISTNNVTWSLKRDLVLDDPREQILWPWS